MSAPIDDGGPAFPSPMVLDKDGDVIDPGNVGLTVRQYFAGKAMAALLVLPLDHWPTCKGKDPDGNASTSKTAYALADAMIRAGQA